MQTSNIIKRINDAFSTASIEISDLVRGSGSIECLIRGIMHEYFDEILKELIQNNQASKIESQSLYKQRAGEELNQIWRGESK